ncbi:MlaD family protein [Belliella pelovolcani]|uniref:Phospholipid/cholesterol/gamma-HCH transport system substrate-binding protein n=1 Tax=Belliella pelovolcani TaxID=529505 RepID=A0A1N7LWY6_9BACT|nr:MlaD family protein [Belliella pelovolcani]SIS78314.1 phospholipid/cholesterol/gamma-HCH transport system substrate-binding protein [Belliella pelovolcani]
MKEKNELNSAKLGLMVISGVLFLVFSLYMIGKNQNLFGSSIEVVAVMDNVNGLVPGNNVRYKGMDIGTVKSIDMVNDSSIFVYFLVKRKMQPNIKQNALTSINTDGLMGNKILQIIPQDGDARPIMESDTLYPQNVLSTDEMLKRLGSTGDYFERIAVNLYDITNKLNQSEALWQVLSDQEMTADIKSTIKELKQASQNATTMTKSGLDMLKKLEMGEGMVHTVFTNEKLSEQLIASMDNVMQTSENAVTLIAEIRNWLTEIQEAEGTVNLILQDSTLKSDIQQTMSNLEAGTDNFNQNMEALKQNFLFRRYFRRLEKKESGKIK